MKKQKYGLDALAERHGYSPLDFAIERFAADRQRIAYWQDHYNSGTVPPELSMNWKCFMRIFREEKSDLIRRDHELAPYFHPKKKAVETTVQGADGGAVRFVLEGLKDG